jgi:hypothetical protein
MQVLWNISYKAKIAELKDAENDVVIESGRKHLTGIALEFSVEGNFGMEAPANAALAIDKAWLKIASGEFIKRSLIEHGAKPEDCVVMKCEITKVKRSK